MKNNSWKFVQICGWLKTTNLTNLTNLTNHYLALVNRENRALGVLGVLGVLRVLCESENPYNHAHHQPQWDYPPTTKSVGSAGSVWATPPPASVRFSIHKKNQWDPRDLCEASPPPRREHTKKRRAPRRVRCTPCDWNQSNPISESLIIHLFQV